MKLDKFDLSDASKKYALEKLKEAKLYNEGTIDFVSDKDVLHYKNNHLSQWLEQGDIVKIGTNYYIYLGHSKPREFPTYELKHHIYNDAGKRFVWGLGINIPIKRII